MILVTGGAGFIGSNFVLDWLKAQDESIVNIDKLTYAGNLANLASLAHDKRHIFIQADINDTQKINAALRTHKPRAIVHFAAESHVDRSIAGPGEFIHANITGTFNLLEAARQYWNELPQDEKNAFRFILISTDEVYGSLELHDPAFTETTAYAPNSPYSASKAAADHLARAYFHTYGLPTIITHCSNNFGPYQFPEKLIPVLITKAVTMQPLPIYGDGKNVRDWLYVSDHTAALRVILQRGIPGEAYNIGGNNEKTNLDVVNELCTIMDELEPQFNKSYRELITFVKDRPGHDRRYAVDISKLTRELGWQPQESFQSGLRKTVLWYLENTAWLEDIRSRNK